MGGISQECILPFRGKLCFFWIDPCLGRWSDIFFSCKSRWNWTGPRLFGSPWGGVGHWQCIGLHDIGL